MSNPVVDNGIAALNFSRQSFMGLVEDIPEDKLTFQPFAGANHALWNMGHMAATDDYFLTALGNKAPLNPPSWNELFGMGSTPQPDAARYPAASELREALNNNREQLLAWFQSLSDEQLNAPLPDDWKAFAQTFGGLLGSMAFHEGMHTGQLTVIRKALGLTPKFG